MQIQKPKQGYKLVKSFFGKIEEIPDDWEVTTHSKVCEFINGYAYSQSEISEKGYPIIRIQNLTGGDNFVYSNVLLPEKQFAIEGDLLFAWSATFGPFIWNGPKAAFHYHQWKVIPNNESDKKFLYYHLVRISPLIKRMGQSGLGMFHMTKQGMEKFRFFKPQIKEQQKIASILSNIDSLIQQTQNEIVQTQRLKKGLMHKLLIKGIGNSKFKKVRWFFGSLEIPDNWKIDKLINNVEKNTTISYGIVQADSNLEKGVSYFRTLDVTKKEVNLENLWKTSPEISNKYKKTILKKGDLIVTVRASVGNVKLITEEFEGCNLSRGVARISPNDQVNSSFLFQELQSSFIQKQLSFLTNGTTFKDITMENLRNLKILIPPMNEQEKIISILNDVDSKIVTLESKYSRFETLKKGLMQKLLTGQIRVKI